MSPPAPPIAGAPREDPFALAERLRWILFPLVAVGAGAYDLRFGWTWHFLVAGARVLASPYALHVYGRHPAVQMGPLALIAAVPFVVWLPPAIGRIAAMAAMSGLGLVALRQVEVLAARRGPLRPPVRLVAGLLVTVGWADLAVRYGHLDDALALVAALAAVRLVTAERWLGAAAMIAVAVDCKPWAAVFAGVLALAPRHRWPAIGALLVGLVAICWLPFPIADPKSIAALRYTIRVSPSSTIGLLGIAHGRTPAWCRPLQLAGGFALSVACARRGRLPAALAVPVAWRMLLDPSVHGYYASGLLLLAALVDESRGRRLAGVTVAAFALVSLPTLLDPQVLPDALAVVRSAGLVVVAVLAAATAPALSRPWPGSVPRATPRASRLEARP